MHSFKYTSNRDCARESKMLRKDQNGNVAESQQKAREKQLFEPMFTIK